MEKRLILAIFLSFLVLMMFSVLSPEKSVPVKVGLDPQSIENKLVNNESAIQTLPNVETIPPVVKIAGNITNKIDTLQSDDLILEFSNIGGVLKSVRLRGYEVTLPATDVIAIDGYENMVFKREMLDNHSIRYVYDDVRYRVVKEYRLTDGAFNVQSVVTLENKSSNILRSNLAINDFIIDMSKLNDADVDKNVQSRDRMFKEYFYNVDGKINRKNNAFKFSEKNDKIVKGIIRWVGYRDRYYCLIIRPDYETSSFESNYISESELGITAKPVAMDAAAGDVTVYKHTIFVGPQDSNILKSVDWEFKDVVNFNLGNFFDIFALGLGDPAAKVLLKVLLFLKGILHSWGLGIIFTAILVCGVTYPLTMSSMSSMRRMQLIQPETVKLREKFKDNPQRLNKETMALYKKHGVNPLGGCLPMFIQMPIFFGVIQLLWRYVGLKGQGFLWIADLSEPDRFLILPTSLPIIGNEINLLPLIVFILAILQQIFSSKNIVTTDPNMAMQQKIMKFMFPAMIILFFYKFASSVGLYFTVFYMYQTFIQWKMSKLRIQESTAVIDI